MHRKLLRFFISDVEALIFGCI